MAHANTYHTVQSLIRRSSQKMALGAALAVLGGGVLLPHLSQAQTQKAPAAPRRPAPPQKAPAPLEYETKSITFRDGVPVGGWSNLTLYSDGRYHFTGHFHVSGAPSYDVSLAWMVRASTGKAFLFSKKGHLHGTFESGSRNYDWDQSGANENIKQSWAQLASGSKYEWRTKVNVDMGSLISEVKEAVETAGKVVEVVEVAVP